MTHWDEPARPGASWWLPERLEPPLVALGVEVCQGCELHENAPGVPGRGPVPAPVVLVGVQPVPEEAEGGDANQAQYVLRSALEQAGLDLDAVWSTYVVKHAGSVPSAGDGLHPAHVAACAPWWRAELEMIRPRWVVLLGDVVARTLLGTDLAARLVRGQPAAWPRELDRAVRRLDVAHHPERVLLTGDPGEALAELGRPMPAQIEALVADFRPVALDGASRGPSFGARS
ncbi:hypothetical protein GCM10027596_41270 [Nocardioides korecus]